MTFFISMIILCYSKENTEITDKEVIMSIPEPYDRGRYYYFRHPSDEIRQCWTVFLEESLIEEKKANTPPRYRLKKFFRKIVKAIRCR